MKCIRTVAISSSLPGCCSTSLVFKTSLQTSETWNLGTFSNFDIGADWKVDGDRKGTFLNLASTCY